VTGNQEEKRRFRGRCSGDHCTPEKTERRAAENGSVG